MVTFKQFVSENRKVAYTLAGIAILFPLLEGILNLIGIGIEFSVVSFYVVAVMPALAMALLTYQHWGSSDPLAKSFASITFFTGMLCILFIIWHLLVIALFRVHTDFGLAAAAILVAAPVVGGAYILLAALLGWIAQKQG